MAVLFVICFGDFIGNAFMAFEGVQSFEPLITQSFRIWSHVTYYWIDGLVYGGIKNLGNSDYERIRRINGKVLVAIILWVVGSIIQYEFSRVVMNVTSPEYMFTCPFMILINASVFALCYLIEIKSVSSRASMLIKYSLGIYISSIHPFIITVLQHFNQWDTIG